MEKYLAVFYLNSTGHRTCLNWEEVDAISFTQARETLIEYLSRWRIEWDTVDYTLYDKKDKTFEGSAKRLKR